MADRFDISTKRCLWCLKPMDGTSKKRYCSDKCRQSAYRWRKKGSPAPVFGDGSLRGMSGEDAAEYLTELKAVLCRMAALKGRGDAIGDACSSLAAAVSDQLREMGL